MVRMFAMPSFFTNYNLAWQRSLKYFHLLYVFVIDGGKMNALLS
jgi:hypothetical protein